MNSVLDIPLDQIEVGERLRSVDPDHAALIAESFRANGQIQPIEVTKTEGGYRLIAGAHRLEAARIAGMATIRAVAVEANELQARLREIDENLCRRELSALDRATFLAERHAIYVQLHPETKRGGKREKTGRYEQNDTRVVLFPTFAEEVAEKLRVSPRTIQRAIHLGRALLPDVCERIATTWIADSGRELDRIAALDAGMQRRVLDALLRDEEPAKSVSAALTEITGTKTRAVNEAAQQYQALLKAWGKAGRKARRQFIDFLVAEGAFDAPGRTV